MATCIQSTTLDCLEITFLCSLLMEKGYCGQDRQDVFSPSHNTMVAVQSREISRLCYIEGCSCMQTARRLLLGIR
jgi:hypothetical protein